MSSRTPRVAFMQRRPSLTRTTREREEPEAESEVSDGGGEEGGKGEGKRKKRASTPSCNLGNHHHEVLSTRAASVVGAEPRSSFFLLPLTTAREAHTHSHKIPISSPDVTLKGVQRTTAPSRANSSPSSRQMPRPQPLSLAR